MPTLVMKIEDRLEMLETHARHWERFIQRREAMMEMIDWSMMTPADRHAAAEDDEAFAFDGLCIYSELEQFEALASADFDW